MEEDSVREIPNLGCFSIKSEQKTRYIERSLHVYNWYIRIYVLYREKHYSIRLRLTEKEFRIRPKFSL